MPSTPSAAPTPITPPRVPLIDERTGLIDRTWYLFFLGLFQSATTQEDAAKGFDLTSALASYDEALRTLAQDVKTVPPQIDTAGLYKQLNDLQQDVATAPSQVDTESLAKQLNDLQQEVQTAVRPALGTMAQLQQTNVPWLTFDTTPEAVPTIVGTVSWDGGTTLSLQATTDVSIELGEAEYVYVKASSAITKGQLCYHTGSVGASGVITAAPTLLALTDPNQIIGIAAETIALNGFGLIQISGTLRGFNTTGSSVGETWADGDPLYYNPLYVGSMTKVKPSAPNQKTYIGEVITAGSGGSGSVNIRLVSGSILGGTDSNVEFTTLVDKNLIQYDSTAGYWKNITHFFLDATNKRMGINVPLPSTTLVINANASTTPPTPLTGTVFDSHGANGSPNRFAVNAYGNAPSVTFVRANNTMASPSGVASGDALGLMVGTGYNGAAYTTGRVSMLFFAAENWTTTANGTDIRFTTTPLGAAVAEERFRFGPAGQLGIVVSGVVDYGSSAQVLASGGASAAPYWRTLQGIPALNIITTTTHTGSSNNHYVLTNAAASTLTLPASPTAGDLVWVTTGNGLTTNVVDRNGNNIEGAATNLTLTATQQYVQLRYVNATLGWMRV